MKIGIFDSGIGGLTIAHSINKKFPHLDIIFYGDTAHLPYGDKSAKNIKFYSDKISTFLFEEGCNIVVIACNTASAFAGKTLQRKYKESKILNVIDPAVQRAANIEGVKSIGVIGTKGTISSRIYPRRIQKIKPELKVFSAATPLLAPMIEEGFYNNNISQTIINSYLSKHHLNNIDLLILACTHYPLIKNQINEFYNKSVMLIDSTDVINAEIERNLEKGKKVKEELKGSLKFYVSDYTRSFEKTASIFFGRRVQLTEVNFWN